MFISINFPVFTFVSFLLFTMLTIYAYRFRHGLGGNYLLLTLLLTAVLSITSVFELMSLNIQDKLFWRNIQQVPLFLTTIALYGVVLELLGRDKRKVLKQVVILSIPIITYLALIFTDSFHHLMRQSVSLSSFGELTRLSIEPTQLSMYFMLYLNIIAVILIITILSKLKTVSTFNRKQFYILLFVLIIPFILSYMKAVFDLNISTSTSSIPGGILIFYSMIQYKFLSVSPIAKDKIIENLSEGIIVLNQNDLIIELNPAAREILDGIIVQNKIDFFGKDIKEIVRNHLELKRFLANSISGKQQIEFNGKYYNLAVIPVGVTKGLMYRLLILTDLTERVCYEKELYDRATKDQLTKLYNRQYLNEIASQKMADIQKMGGSVSFIILDIDRFKSINDSFGHQAGDKVLEKIGAVMTELVNDSGIVARMGGEEFAILLPNITEEHAFRLAEDVRKGIEILKVCINKDQYISVTVSLGLKSISNSDMVFSELYREADKALYTSKENGRNQTTIAKALHLL